MSRIDFTKMVASGNDFVIVEAKNQAAGIKKPDDLAKLMCDRKSGIGADGLLLLEDTNRADIRMRIFNPDGSEVDMCGNGARCCAGYFSFQLLSVNNQPIKIETKAGMLEAFVSGDMVKLKMSEPHNIRLDIKLMVNSLQFTANYINTGVPHVVIFVENLGKVDVEDLGRRIRYHKDFASEGTNVDFVKILGKDRISIRTYERGVEGETLACGTGAVASAIITNYELRITDYENKTDVLTKSGEVLKVYFNKKGDNIKNVFLEGNAKIVYSGRFNHDF